MSDQYDQFSTIEPVPPEFEPLHRRLLDDGAAWRAGLPSTGRLERELHALLERERAAQQPLRAHRRGRFRLIVPGKIDGSGFQSRSRIITAVLTLVAVVALFAVLLHGFAGGHAPSAGNGTSTSTTAKPTLSATATEPKDGTTEISGARGLPVVAPGDPQVVYELVPIQTGSTEEILMRTSDGGATWQNLALPPLAGQINAQIPPALYVSPLNSATLFLIITYWPASSGSCPSPVALRSGLNALAAFSGQNLCSVQYFSQDGGTDWQVLHLPAGLPQPSVLGDTSPLYFHPNIFPSSVTVLRAQGNRLYSTVGEDFSQGAGQSYSTVRLITSTDGGLTWHIADTRIVASGLGVCDYQPTPSGSTIFAIAANGCDSPSAQPTYLWRSDDAGTHWSEVGQLPDQLNRGMVVVSRGNGAQPLLYIDMSQLYPGSLCCPNGSTDPTDVQVSADGGKTWQRAPAQGSMGAGISPGAPLGVLSDGSILFANNYDFYSWKLGDAAWQHLKTRLSSPFSYVFLTPPGADGKQTLWAVMVVTSDSGQTYTVQSFQL